jgi:hypothetical protein
MLHTQHLTITQANPGLPSNPAHLPLIFVYALRGYIVKFKSEAEGCKKTMRIRVKAQKGK